MQVKLLVDARWGDKREEFGEAGTQPELTEEQAQRLLDAGLAELPADAEDKKARKPRGRAH